jgi:hypothetical protein
MESGSWRVEDVLGEDRFLMSSPGISGRSFYFWTPSLVRPKRIIFKGVDTHQKIEAARFATSTNDYFILLSSGRLPRGLYHFDAEKPTAIALDPKSELESFFLDHRHFHLYLNWVHDGRSWFEARDPSTFAELNGSTFDRSDSVRVVRTSRYGRYVTLESKGINGGRTFSVYDWKDHKLTRWLGNSPLGSLPSTEGSRLWR